MPHAASGESSRNGELSVEQQLDPLARQELAAGPVALDVALAAADPGEVELLLVVVRAAPPAPRGWPGRSRSRGRRSS